MATPSTIESLTIGGRVFTDLDNLVQLVGATTTNSFSGLFDTTTADNTNSFSASGGIFEVHAVRLLSNDGTSLSVAGPLMGYQDNSATINSAAALTNPVYVADAGGVLLGLQAAGGVSAANYPHQDWALRFDIPDGKFPFLQFGGGIDTVLYVWGYQK